MTTAAAPRSAELGSLVPEPLSGSLIPNAIKRGSDHQVLIAAGLRVKKIIIDVKVYVLSIYAFLKDLSDVLAEDAATGGQSVPPKGEVLLSRLLASTAEKSFRMSFLRTLSQKQVVDGLSEGLRSVEVPQRDIDLLASCIPASIQTGDVICLTVKPALSQVIIDDQALASSILCQGLHQVFLGPKTNLQGLCSSIEGQWQLWYAHCQAIQADSATSVPDTAASSIAFDDELDETSVPSAPDGDDDTSAAAAAAAAAAAGPSSYSSKRSWKERSGRSYGKDGYVIGDLTRSLLTTHKKPQPESGDLSAWPGPLVIEQGVTWLSTAQVVPFKNLDSSMEGSLLVHHPSKVRGLFSKEWASRKCQLLHGSFSCWKAVKNVSSPVVRSSSLDGCHVRLEAPTEESRNIDRQVFSIWQGNRLLHRLAAGADEAQHWILALANTCAYFHELEREKVPAKGIGTEKMATIEEFLDDPNSSSQPSAAGRRESAKASASGADDERQVQSPTPGSDVDRRRASSAASSSSASSSCCTGLLVAATQALATYLPSTHERVRSCLSPVWVWIAPQLH